MVCTWHPAMNINARNQEEQPRPLHSRALRRNRGSTDLRRAAAEKICKFYCTAAVYLGYITLNQRRSSRSRHPEPKRFSKIRAVLNKFCFKGVVFQLLGARVDSHSRASLEKLRTLSTAWTREIMAEILVRVRLPFVVSLRRRQKCIFMD